jgi:hypothetical protein
MTTPDRHISLKLLLLIWAIIMGISVFGYALTDPEGDGFARGMNRVVSFLSWQIAGLVLALVCLFLRAAVDRGRPLRWLALVPALVAGAQVLAFVAMYLAASSGVL